MIPTIIHILLWYWGYCILIPISQHMTLINQVIACGWFGDIFSSPCWILLLSHDYILNKPIFLRPNHQVDVWYWFHQLQLHKYPRMHQGQCEHPEHNFLEVIIIRAPSLVPLDIILCPLTEILPMVPLCYRRCNRILLYGRPISPLSALLLIYFPVVFSKMLRFRWMVPQVMLLLLLRCLVRSRISHACCHLEWFIP